MKVVAKTDEYTIYQRRDNRYAVKGADHRPINGDAKVEILTKHDLIKAPPPKAPEPEAAEEPAAEEAAEEAAERRAQQPSLVGRPPAACELKFLRWDLFPAWAPGAETGLSFLRVPWVSLADSRLTSESLECSENIPNAYPANMPFNVLQSRSGH